MTRNTHDIVNDHFGVLETDQIAGGTATSGYVPTSNGDGTSTWAATGTPAFATPAVVLGTAAAAGAASTVIRSDATIVAFDATSPTTQAFGDSATVGAVAKAARRDHKHAMPTAAVTTSGLTQATGKLLGRTTASTGAIEEITVSTGLSMSGGVLTATGGGAATITTKDEGSTLSSTVNTLDFVGAGVVASGSGATTTVTISGGGSGITVDDEGTPLTTLATTLDFVGAGVTATGTGATKTITIPGGSSTFSGARVYRSTDQVLTGGGGPILCNSERYDTDSYHSTGSNTSRLTVPTTATYHFGATVEFEVLSGAGAYNLFVSLMLNGFDEIAIARLPGIATLAGSTPGITVSCDWACTAGDYVELWVQHDAPSAQVDADPPRSPEFWVHRIG